eukprot:Gb_28624 [translate_table: standard]
MSLQSPPPSQALILHHHQQQLQPQHQHHHEHHRQRQQQQQSPSQHQHQQQRHHDHRQQHHEMKEEIACVYPEVRTDIVPTVHSVTKQMQLVSSGAFSSSPANAQSPQQQTVQKPNLHQDSIAQHVYPPPLAGHGEVVADRDLFLNTLTKFHATLGTKLTIPKIGGKDLDLHLLYKEVTARGGLQMVIKERKWKEITLVFNFPRTTTSASFVLRKYYINLLHHYEQVYFFQLKGPLVTPPATRSLSEAEYTHSPSEDPEVDVKKRKIDSAQALGVDPASSIGSVVTGSIDGKFEHGYLVNVMVGTRKMRGVLYHVPSSSTTPQGATVTALMNSLGTDLKTADIEHHIGHRRKKKEMSRKDPNAPRQNRTGYNFFFAEQRARLKTTQPDKDRAISKMIGDLWNRLSEEEKSPYQERGIKEKERYRREMCEYKERLRLQAEGVVGTSCHSSVLQIVGKHDHISNDLGHEFKVEEIKQEAQEQVARPLPESSSGIGSIDRQSVSFGNSGMSAVEDKTPNDGNIVPIQEQGL